MSSDDISKVLVEVISVVGSILSMWLGHRLGQHDHDKEQ